MKRFLKWGFVAMFVSAVAICVVNDVQASYGDNGIGLMSSGPGTIDFDVRKMPCPNCGTVGKLVKVSEINEKPVKNTYCCLECKFIFAVEKK